MMKEFKMIFSAITAAVLFGLATPFSKLLLKDVSPFLLAGLLYLGAGVGLLPFAMFRRNKPELWKRSLKYIVGMILFGGILGPVLFLFGLRMSSASNISLWLNFELVATALLGYFFFKDRLGAVGWAAAFIGLVAGVILYYAPGSGGFLPAIFVLAACVCWALDNHFTALIDGITPMQSAVIKGLCSGAVNLLIALSTGSNAVRPGAVLFALLVGAICYGLSMALYVHSAQKMGAVRSQIVFSSAPLWGITGAMILLREHLTVLQVAAGGLWAAAVILLFWEKHEHGHIHWAMQHVHEHAHDDGHHSHAHDVSMVGHHSHEHKHERKEHAHPHLPDIHHRHDH